MVWMLMQPLGVTMMITVYVTTPFLHHFLFGTIFSLTLVCLLLLIVKVTASYCIANLILNFRHVCRVLLCSVL